MSTELILDRLCILPDNLQLQVLDYVEYLIFKYSEQITKEQENKQEEISPELKALLDERLAEHEQNPQNVVTWEEVKANFDKKYGYAI